MVINSAAKCTSNWACKKNIIIDEACLKLLQAGFKRTEYKLMPQTCSVKNLHLSQSNLNLSFYYFPLFYHTCYIKHKAYNSSGSHGPWGPIFLTQIGYCLGYVGLIFPVQEHSHSNGRWTHSMVMLKSTVNQNLFKRGRQPHQKQYDNTPLHSSKQ